MLMENRLEDTSSSINELSYARGIGAYKPHFAGVPDTYYPLSNGEIAKGFLILFLTIGVTLGIMVGFQFWIVNGGLEGYIIAWVVVLLICIVLAILCFYKGGKDRRRMEKELIAESSRKQQ